MVLGALSFAPAKHSAPPGVTAVLWGRDASPSAVGSPLISTGARAHRRHTGGPISLPHHETPRDLEREEEGLDEESAHDDTEDDALVVLVAHRKKPRGMPGAR